MNRLAGARSPYLRQHASNPVDWYPWGEEALGRAAELDRPLFVSIGYAACHWCHVMAHESFEDPAVARRINDTFVPIKVDREERPDLDAVYLEAVQALCGQGGWPLTVFATPEGRPFFGGTYFPPVAAHGMPAFSDVLAAVAEAWGHRRGEIDRQATELTDAVERRLSAAVANAPGGALGLLDAALARLGDLYDAEHPGIGTAPKFPQAPIIELLLHAGRLGHRDAAAKAEAMLLAMASGGICDQLGGGFHRYSVDRAWVVPHFEKMLYDQATLSRCYLHAAQASGDPRFSQVLGETLSYVLSRLRAPEGGLWSSEDADSEGEEGRFYLWTRTELDEVLGPAGAGVAASWYAVGERGSFDASRSVLRRAEPGELVRPEAVEAARRRLLAARELRPRPGVDDKVLTEWNAMAASTLAEAAVATGSARWAEAAARISDVLWRSARRADGRWLRVVGGTSLAVAGDYASLVDCYTRLGELTGEARYTEQALEVAAELMALFSAPDGGWFTTGADAEALVVRPRELADSVIASAGSVAAYALARLGAISGEASLRRRAEETVEAASGAVAAAPAAFPALIEAALVVELGTTEVGIVGARPDLVDAAARPYAPERVLAHGDQPESPLLSGRAAEGAYVCRWGVCLEPLSDPEAVTAAVRAAGEETGA